MTLDVHFIGGPLDGAIFEGDDSTDDEGNHYFATKIYRDTKCGLVGATFETFNPFMLLEGSPRNLLWLHRYRIEIHVPASGTCAGEIYAMYVCPLSRAIGVSEQAIREWAKR